jgi:uncharacterized cupredoxin-like copper-binding protein
MKRVGLVGVVLAIALTPVVLMVTAPDPASGADVQTVDLRVHYSHFDQSEIHVKAGTTVRFVVHNDDPILHELIVGPPDVQQRHEDGTEPRHPPRPGEITIDPLTVNETTYEFTTPGSIEFACHLPGHHAYGMTGQIVVR